ncbi:Phosphate-specific transport system accessory protein PhoU [Acaryochloris thomasi RCC1774]|uniref:Phosphate-specific transport system accessory protein PhoU n=1 Tax=Acaryochloris thomasi RCC1774 TaxID=1764569 RepID=A0A2W1JVF4_9CYAN|nr:phosphate signaling complex protein PhoU [Acaryochloris thomasi]PZD72457.1 Phosphate-specific transport system accessory protein PhoU [Acaryochloris thomasi RCC1774]
MSQAAKVIRSQYDRKVQAIQSDVLRMGALVEQSAWLAHQALFERNVEVVDRLARQDKQIDLYYRQIEESCLQLIALQSPVATDLRLIGTLMQLVRDLERIGDYAEDLGEVSIQLFPYPVPLYIDDVEHMSNLTRAMLSMSLAALTNLDAESGLEIKKRDDAVDDCYTRIYEILAQTTNIQGSVEPLLLMMLVIRALERMADHATNIGKRVAYVVTGQR